VTLKVSPLVSPLVRAIRRVDTAWQRLLRPDVRQIVFDARTAMEYGMMAPVVRRLGADSRVLCSLMSSGAPDQVATIFRDAPAGIPILSPRGALTRHFDAYVAADLIWASLPRGTWRVQMFHGVAGKWHRVYDRPDTSMRHWDRLFFINRRRMENYIASGAIDRGSPAIRLVGMPKSDCLLDGNLSRDAVLEEAGLDPRRPTILYAPTWSRFSSLNAMGEDIVRGLVAAGYTVLVKLHENSLDPAYFCSGGVDWIARLTPVLPLGRGVLVRSSDASPWLVAADVLITDHSSIGFEYLLLDRPVVRIAMPQLIAGTDIGAEYVRLMGDVSTTVETPSAAVTAVTQSLADPRRLSDARRSLAAELFLNPGAATACAVQELYTLMELDGPPPAEAAYRAAAVGSRTRSFAQ
jgi:hypothetical protein